MILRNKLWASLWRRCRGWTRTPDDAEELIQQAFLQLEEYRYRGGVVRNEVGFLLRTARNLAVSQLRRGRVVSYAEEPVEEIAERLFLADPSLPPEDTIDNWKQLDEIERRLETVSKRRGKGRMYAKMYFQSMAGFTYQEIAEHFGCSRLTVV